MEERRSVPGDAFRVGDPFLCGAHPLSDRIGPKVSAVLPRGASLVLVTLVSLGLWAGIWAAIGSLLGPQ
jgi:hypothetical protein